MFEDVCEIVIVAGRRLVDKVNSRFTVETKGSDMDLVTEMDKKTEKYITEEIKRDFPEHAVFGEETVEEIGHDKMLEMLETHPNLWVIDPIDGTTNYVHGLPGYTISVALYCKGEAAFGIIYDPVANELFIAERGKGATLNGEAIHVSGQGSLAESLVSTGVPAKYESDRNHVLEGYVKIAPLTRNVRTFGSAALHCAYVASGRLDAFWEWGVNIWDIAAGRLIVEEAGGSVYQLDGSDVRFEFPNFTCTNGKIDEEWKETFASIHGFL
ncbi:inositol monophosphatase family protein [Oceanobacillus oncorhynchi subsp. oncorhynchi]|uniref:inositol monophosphatase family protein n=1 Tax=Oceanobacillus oncorhynchi TaxID=545501 RepID=UPI003637537D